MTAARRSDEIVVRRAQPRDRRSVEEICRHIWDGGDYLPEVFDEWVSDRRGGLWLATLERQVVGVAKLTVLGDREAWLHALRVDRRYRRRGVGSALFVHRLDRAVRLGARVARFDTSDDNTAIHRLASRFGFRRTGRYTFFRIAAHAGGAARIADRSELGSLVALSKTGDGLLHGRYARRAIAPTDVGRALRRHDLLVSGPIGRPAAMAIVEPMVSPAGTRKGPSLDRLGVVHISGKGVALRSLLAALPAEAKRRGLAHVGLTAEARHWPALRAAEYRRQWSGSMHVFERPLSRSTRRGSHAVT